MDVNVVFLQVFSIEERAGLTIQILFYVIHIILFTSTVFSLPPNWMLLFLYLLARPMHPTALKNDQTSRMEVHQNMDFRLICSRVFTMTKFREAVEDRTAWRALVHGVKKSRTRLND